MEKGVPTGLRKKSEAEETKQIRTLAIALVVLISAFTAIRYGLRGMPEGAPVLAIIVGASVIVLLISLAKPSILRPAFKYWMIGARAIGWFNARLLLSVMFFIMFTPIAFLMRLFGRHTVDRKFKTDCETYWIAREEPREGRERYTRQY